MSGDEGTEEGVGGIDVEEERGDDDDAEEEGAEDVGREELLNWEQRRKSGQEALNMWRTGSQPRRAASQKDRHGNTARLLSPL